ncbi:MAG: Asp-tRNA(Asn)/Glu-tRNA(Gln) amidotransferase subunit GatC [Parcubacteria group bacterium]
MAVNERAEFASTFKARYHTFVMARISEGDIERLAKLARVDIEGKEEKLLKDAEEILGYFEELKQVDTENILPLSGATEIVNAVGKDEINSELLEKGIASFPETEKGCLKVPGVMINRSQNE